MISQRNGRRLSTARPPIPLSVKIREDYFRYFTQGKAVNITSLEMFGDAPAKYHAIGDAGTATTDLGDNTKLAFTVSARTLLARPRR